MPPSRFRKVIEDDEEEIPTTREDVESEQIKGRKTEKKGGIKRKIVESDDSSSSEDELDERLELTDEDDIESLSSRDSPVVEYDDNDEEMEEYPQYNRLLEIEKAILDKLEGRSCDQQLIIHSIEMKNFKSYKDNTLVGPFTTGLNCIIGSNGSGKSNIIDSICFVLGFESKELRAKNLDYLINDQCSSDEESFVKINFNVMNGKNDCFKQFSIQRKIKRNDHTSSYHLSSPNEESKKITKKQVRELLNEYGIDFDYPDRFIVMQHNTIKMVKQNPLEMLFHLEKLFGTDRVQIEIKQVQEDITKLRSDIEIHEKEKNDCEKDLELLKPIVEHYQNFQKLEKKVEETKASIKESELKCLTFKLDKSKRELKSITSEISSLESNRSNSKIEEQQLNESTQKQVEKMDTTEKELDQIKKVTSKIQKNLLRVRLENDSYNQKVQHFEMELERTSKESIQLGEEKNDLNVMNCHTEEDIKYLENCINSLENEINRLTSNIDDESQQILIDLQRELNEIVTSYRYTALTSRSVKLRELEEQIEILNQTFDQKQKEKVGLENYMEEISELKKLADSEASILGDNLKRVQESIELKKKQRIKIEDEIFDLETSSIQKEEVNSLFLDTIKKIRSGIDGCFGTIPEIYRITDQKYAVSVNSVLHPYLKNTVVVSSREVALKVVKFFENDRAGLVSCEILNELKLLPNQSSTNPLELKPLIEVLECEAQYRPLLEKHTQGWFITDSIECAMKYSYHNGKRRNIVTLDGKIFKSFGEISCHYSKDTTPHQISTQYSKLNTNYADHTKDIEYLSILKKKSKDLEEIFENLLMSMNDIKQSISEKEVLTRNYQSQIKKIGTSLSTLSRKLISIKKDLESKQETFKNTILAPTEEAELLEIETIKKELEMKIHTIESVDNSGNSLPNLKKTLSEKQKEHTVLNKLKETQSKRLNQISALLSNLAAKREKYTNELDIFRKENNQEELDSLESEVDSLKRQKGKLESKKEGYCNKLKEFRRNLKKLSQIINEKDLQISRKVQDKEKIQEDTDELKLSISKIAQSNISLKVDTKLDLELEERRRLKLISELKHINSELEGIQDSVDKNCLEKQSTAKKKLKFTNKRLNSINQRIESLELLESKFLTLRYELFHKVISKINENLSQIFRDLNNNSNCYISYYEDKKTLFEKGVNIYCKYDSEWKEFSKLSGGQKNLVCSVLSKALMRCFSTSICIFDELCSSLDTINVEKLAKLIKSSSLKTQFICISFKFYEKADHIIGVYHQNGVSCTVPFSNK